MRPIRRWLIILALLILAFLLIAPSQGDPAQARAVTMAPSIQASSQAGSI